MYRVLKQSTVRLTVLLPVVALLGTAAAAQERQQQPAPELPQSQSQSQSQAQKQQLMQQIMTKRAEIEELNEQLQEIQQATLESNPEIAEQRDDFVSLMDSRMAEAGHDPAASRDRIENLQGQLQDQELSQQKRESVGQELREEVSDLQQAQQQAMQGQEVQAQRESLNEDLMSAMAEQDPKTEQLISKLRTAQQEYQQLVSQARQQQSGPAVQPQGGS